MTKSNPFPDHHDHNFIPACSHATLTATHDADMSASDSSELSSPPTTDDEAVAQILPQPSGLDRYFKPAAKGTPKVPSSPPPPKRPASPPHEYVLADNADIAVSGSEALCEGDALLILWRSLLLCSVRGFTTSFPSHYPTTDHKISREVLLRQCPATTLRNCCARCLGWS